MNENQMIRIESLMLACTSFLSCIIFANEEEFIFAVIFLICFIVGSIINLKNHR